MSRKCIKKMRHEQKLNERNETAYCRYRHIFRENVYPLLHFLYLHLLRWWDGGSGAGGSGAGGSGAGGAGGSAAGGAGGSAAGGAGGSGTGGEIHKFIDFLFSANIGWCDI